MYMLGESGIEDYTYTVTFYLISIYIYMKLSSYTLRLEFFQCVETETRQSITGSCYYAISLFLIKQNCDVTYQNQAFVAKMGC